MHNNVNVQPRRHGFYPIEKGIKEHNKSQSFETRSKQKSQKSEQFHPESLST